MKKRKRKLTPTKFILLGYLLIILLGAILLCLPIASREGRGTPFLDSLFTATSATCVTGLVRFDTYSYWSLFGQLIILLLIQIGGIGFMTIAIFLMTMTSKKIGLSQRSIMQDSIAAPQLGGIVRNTRFLLFGSFIIEGIGALLLCFYFCPRLGIAQGVYYSIFHSISAFCNAGFDLMGRYGPYSSLASAADNLYVNLILMLLIFIGGLGFFVWLDACLCKFRFKKLRLHSKLALTVSLLLIPAGALFLFLLEQRSAAFAGKSVGQKILCSFFQSVSARTAGFSSIDLSKLGEPGQLIMTVLMLIGGSPGSTAGGLKTTTFAVILLSVLSTFRQRKAIECFGRRIEDDTLRSASCILCLYLTLTLIGTVLISSVEHIGVGPASFETVSAVATVGLTLGITPSLGPVSLVVLIILMIFGRVGSLTMLMAFSGGPANIVSKYPSESVRVG